MGTGEERLPRATTHAPLIAGQTQTGPGGPRAGPPWNGDGGGGGVRRRTGEKGQRNMDGTQQHGGNQGLNNRQKKGQASNPHHTRGDVGQWRCVGGEPNRGASGGTDTGRIKGMNPPTGKNRKQANQKKPRRERMPRAKVTCLKPAKARSDHGGSDACTHPTRSNASTNKGLPTTMDGAKPLRNKGGHPRRKASRLQLRRPSHNLNHAVQGEKEESRSNPVRCEGPPEDATDQATASTPPPHNHLRVGRRKQQTDQTGKKASHEGRETESPDGDCNPRQGAQPAAPDGPWAHGPNTREPRQTLTRQGNDHTNTHRRREDAAAANARYTSQATTRRLRLEDGLLTSKPALRMNTPITRAPTTINPRNLTRHYPPAPQNAHPPARHRPTAGRPPDLGEPPPPPRYLINAPPPAPQILERGAKPPTVLGGRHPLPLQPYPASLQPGQPDRRHDRPVPQRLPHTGTY
uniref:Uncharacterized protein n=1 Tax=Knipowitschia caucasica TaxID=637954 RepID=A0AAV2KIT3_KNICA